MTQLLHIDSSARPGIRGLVPHGSHTRALTHRFVTQWQAHDALHGTTSKLHYRDVDAAPPTPVTAQWIRAAFTEPAARSAQLQSALNESDMLVAELRAADIVILGAPMYNFGPPAGLKAWIDNIVRVGETFLFDPHAANHYTPLLADKPRTVVLLTSRGAGDMGPGAAMAHLNHLDDAVRTALGLLGLTDFHVVAIEHDEHGGALLTQSVADAMESVDQLVAQLHANTTVHQRQTAPLAV